MEVAVKGCKESNILFRMMARTVGVSPSGRKSRIGMDGAEDEGLSHTLGVSTIFLRVSDSLMRKSIKTLKRKRDEYVQMIRQIKQIQWEGAEKMLRYENKK